jgi:hypothetical protein
VDNLNIHTPASFYEVFDAERARELSRRIEFRYMPVHGSWLNMAEIEISVLVRQCLGKRRMPDAQTLRREARAWYEARNQQQARGDWRFTTAEARTKLRRLYPSIERCQRTSCHLRALRRRSILRLVARLVGKTSGDRSPTGSLNHHLSRLCVGHFSNPERR